MVFQQMTVEYSSVVKMEYSDNKIIVEAASGWDPTEAQKLYTIYGPHAKIPD